MRRFILRRLLVIPATLLVVSVLVFVITAVVPGDVARDILGREATAEAVRAQRTELGLDRRLVVQYGDWLWGFVRGDWGRSFTSQEDVRSLVLDRLANSLLLAGFAFVLLAPLAIGLGLLAGMRRGGRLDRAISVGGLTFASIPEFVTGVVLLIVFAVQLGWFPTSAKPPDGAGLVERLHRLVLPAVGLVLVSFGYVARMARAGTVATMESGFVRAAVMRGLRRRDVVRRHVLRNSLMPTVTVLGSQLSYLIGALVTVEVLYSYPGLGNLLLEAANDKNLPTMQATAMVVGIAYMLIVLATDVIYGALDPRVRLHAAPA